MSAESLFVAALDTCCPNVFPDYCPDETPPVPYVTWQGVGGQPLRSLDNVPGDKRNTVVMVKAWTKRRNQTLTLIRTIEDTVCAVDDLIVIPQGEPMSVYEDDTKLYGSIQYFSIWGAR